MKAKRLAEEKASAEQAEQARPATAPGAWLSSPVANTAESVRRSAESAQSVGELDVALPQKSPNNIMTECIAKLSQSRTKRITIQPGLGLKKVQHALLERHRAGRTRGGRWGHPKLLPISFEPLLRPGVGEHIATGTYSLLK